jgi:hypothetical protein
MQGRLETTCFCRSGGVGYVSRGGCIYSRLQEPAIRILAECIVGV